VYPINLDLKNRLCAVLGGGNVALRKVKTLLAAEARITVIAPVLTGDLAHLAKIGQVNWVGKKYESGDLHGFFLVICATNNSPTNIKAAIEAKREGALVNVAEPAHFSDFTVPAQVRRGDLLLTVSTGGKSPALARQLRRELEKDFGDTYGAWLEQLTLLRKEMRSRLESSQERELFWRQALDAEVLELVKRGELKKAEAKIRDAIGSFGSES
jgi:precorrin-2 dehydrogenase / sirohydrochlorin ferrochelatase